MRLIRFARDLKDLQGTYRDLAAEAARADDDASYKLTLMARGFARRSRRVVDDKLSFSATLMRAGEVDGANRLLEEVQTEVRTEEAALMEKVHEAKAAQAVRKDKMTRLRLVRLVAVAVVGSMLMGMSAVGFAAVSYLEERERDSARAAGGSLQVASVEREMRAHKLAKRLTGAKDKRVADILMKLSMADLRMLGKLYSQGADVYALEKFLTIALPSADLARELTDTIVAVASDASAPVSADVKKAAEDGLDLVAAGKKRAKEETEAKEEAAEKEAEEPASEPADEPAPDDGPTDDRNPDDGQGGPTLPPGGPFDGNSSEKETDGDGLLD